MVLDINVLGACMELGIFRQCHGTLIVAVDHHRFGGLVTGIELVQKTTQPYCLLGSLRLADILGLTG